MNKQLGCHTCPCRALLPPDTCNPRNEKDQQGKKVLLTAFGKQGGGCNDPGDDGGDGDGGDGDDGDKGDGDDSDGGGDVGDGRRDGDNNGSDMGDGWWRWQW